MLALLVPPAAVEGQPAGRVYRVGWLTPAVSPPNTLELQALREGLRNFGYVEGQNLVLEIRAANGNPALLPALAAALVDSKVDVIVTGGTAAGLAAKRATRTIPIVFAQAAFPERSGLVANCARPGGNVTGLAFVGPEYGKRLELLRQVSPHLSRVALLYNHENPGSVLAVEEIGRWAERLGVTLGLYGVARPEDIEKVFTAIRVARPDALMTTADLVVTSYRARTIEFANQHRLLSIYPNRDFVTAGGLMFYGTSVSDMYRKAAVYVDRILKGARPGELPVEQNFKFDLVINLKTAKALGLTIPPLVLARVDEVIE
ncbi:MAG TPA: ABC transporter substrate-binding protein [Methylomirabilota bacterium]|nr:ABC transporter substrate-binding protein [Methylomirabilota bacterium]